MKKILMTLAVAALSSLGLMAQNDPVVIEVGGQQIRSSEFMREFNSNVKPQLDKRHDITDAEKRAALEEYVDLYALFRAKLLDAHERGFDTMAPLKAELARYRKELAAPYLIDSAVLQHLLAEAYERNHYSLHAAHILVSIPASAAPEDSTKAYEKAMELYNRITVGGEEFFDVAAEYYSQVDPDGKRRPNEGDLGYFTVFEMVYPFENAAYALKVGEVSKPIRTRFGYHIINLLDRVEGLYGKITMAHIWLHSTDSASRRSEIYQIYDELKRGVNFTALARQSDDRTTSSKGGVLTDATLSQLPPEYIHELVPMKEGEFSKPFFTQYGWHIIKLIQRDTLPGATDLEGFYKQRMTRDQRGDASRKTFAANCRKKYGIVDLTTTPAKQTVKGRKKKGAPVKMMASLDELIRVVPDTVRYGRWKINEGQFVDTSALVVTPDRRYTSLDVARYISTHQKKARYDNMRKLLQERYEEFLDSVTIVYADSQLEKEYPEFAQVVEEYRRGLMIFNYNDALIWHKAIEDSAGLVDFYARESRNKRLDNPDDSIYFFHPRARVTVIDVADADALAPKKAQKIIEKAVQKEMGSSEMKQQLMKKIDRKKHPADNLIKVSVDQVEKSRQSLLADDQWQRGVYLVNQNTGYRLIAVEEILPRSLKGIGQARGYYLNAWQNEVERNLNENLRKQYNVKIDRNVVRSLSF
ncbi:MAG: peptidylprolyl isomerase [Bacteroidales bacterium]|nr:peptidylprolyl isomerase [Bacteroidales bacterium]